MGETVSTLVFRPPRPTYLKPTRYFFLDVESVDPNSVGCGTSEGSCTGSSSSSGGEYLPHDGKHRIPAFFIKRRGAKLTLLFSHGNAEDLGMMYTRMKEMAKILGVNVMAYDYTGYGYSTGSPSEDMCYRNIEAAYDYLIKVLKIPSSEIVLYGRSLGSGPSCHLAAKTANEGRSVAGLILHSPFLSIYRIVVNSGFTVVGDKFSNVSRAPDVRCPVLIIHGTHDEVVPFSHGQELLMSFPPHCRAEPFWAEGLGHNNIEVYLRQIYTERCLDFLSRYVMVSLGGCEGQRSVSSIDPYRPFAIPEDEQASLDKGTLEANTFFINPTWVKYGQRIVNDAVKSKLARDEDRMNTLERRHSTSEVTVSATEVSSGGDAPSRSRFYTTCEQYIAHMTGGEESGTTSYSQSIDGRDDIEGEHQGERSSAPHLLRKDSLLSKSRNRVFFHRHKSSSVSSLKMMETTSSQHLGSTQILTSRLSE